MKDNFARSAFAVLRGIVVMAILGLSASCITRPPLLPDDAPEGRLDIVDLPLIEPTETEREGVKLDLGRASNMKTLTCFVQVQGKSGCAHPNALVFANREQPLVWQSTSPRFLKGGVEVFIDRLEENTYKREAKGLLYLLDRNDYLCPESPSGTRIPGDCWAVDTARTTSLLPFTQEHSADAGTFLGVTDNYRFEGIAEKNGTRYAILSLKRSVFLPVFRFNDDISPESSLYINQAMIRLAYDLAANTVAEVECKARYSVFWDGKLDEIAPFVIEDYNDDGVRAIEIAYTTGSILGLFNGKTGKTGTTVKNASSILAQAWVYGEMLPALKEQPSSTPERLAERYIDADIFNCRLLEPRSYRIVWKALSPGTGQETAKTTQ